MNLYPRFTSYVVQKGLLEKSPFCLVDVGASGGISSVWNVFGSSLKAFGFEPLLHECERLNRAQDKLQGVEYFPFFITTDEEEVASQPPSEYHARLWQRASCRRALEVGKIDYIQKFYNQGSHAEYTTQKISLDSFLSRHSVKDVDFIKIDTDGDDFKALHGAQKTLHGGQVLGVSMEAQFQGHENPYSNTFRNIDRLLTESGFYLFDLQPARYTKRDLPGKFAYSVPAQTTSGQLLWAEALYLRDVVGEELREKDLLSPIKWVKLASMFEMFNLEDCAVELIRAKKEHLSPLLDVDHALNLLTKSTGFRGSYSEYIRYFESRLQKFFPKECKGLFRRAKRKIGHLLQTLR